MAQITTGGPSGAFGVDDVYMSLNPPQPYFTDATMLFNGAVVGGASWGPKNVAVSNGSPQDLQFNFGPPINSGFDVVQEGSLFFRQQPQGGLYVVRVAQGDVAAAGTLMDTAGAPAVGLNITAFYTGSFGNQIKVALFPGSNDQATNHTYKVVVQAGTLAPEIFDRIAAGATPADTWQNIANAINNGIGNAVPASKFITATVAASTAAPNTAQSITLTGGTDGATAITTANLIGADGASGSRTGMYALRGVSFDAVWLAGCTDSTSWSTVLGFAKAHFAEGYGAFPKNTGVSAAVTAKLTAGIDDPYMVLLKDFVYYADTIVNATVAVPPSCVAAGIACRMAPWLSPGNKQAYGLVGTENTMVPNAQPYSATDLTALEAAGINLICNPIPAANAFGLRHGKNTSSNFATSEITYTRMTNKLLRDFGSNVAGQFVNQVQTTNANDPLRAAVIAAFIAYLGPMKGAGQIVDFVVQCDLNNNPPSRIRQGYLRVDITVQYLAVVDKFIINLTAGQTVEVLAASQQQQAA